MRVAVVQFAATTDTVANLEVLAPLVREACRQGAELIVAPEASMHDFGSPEVSLGRAAQPVEGRLRAIAVIEAVDEHCLVEPAGRGHRYQLRRDRRRQRDGR